MKNLWVYMMALLCLVASCTSDIPTTGTSQNRVSVRLVVSLGSSQSGTRASEASLNDAVGNEYYINPSDIDVLLYNSKGQYITKATNVQAVRNATVSTSQNEYTISGTMTTPSGDFDMNADYEFVVIANANGSCPITRSTEESYMMSESSINSAMTYGLGENKTFTTFTEGILKDNTTDNNATERIPMWGKKTVKLSEVAKDSEEAAKQNPVTIDLLRAMAKVTVSCKAEGHKLTAVQLEGEINQSGYVTPAKAAESKNTQAALNLSSEEYTNVLNIPSQSASKTAVSFVNADNNGTYYLFIPEQEAGKTSMTVTIDDEDQYTIKFANYSGSSHDNEFPVVRNYWYDYTITSVAEKTVEVSSLKYMVNSWTSKTAATITFN
jgi:hypothetical protein